MTTKIQTNQAYVSPEFENYFDKFEHEQLTTASLMGKQDGLVGKPETEHHYRIQNVSVFKTAVQKAIEFNNSMFQPASNLAVAKELRSSSSSRIQVLEKEKNSNEKKLLEIKNAQRELRKTFSPFSSFFRIMVPLIFGLVEGLMIFNILQNASMSFMFSVILSISLTLAAALGLNSGANFICKTPKEKSKAVRYALVIFIGLLASVALGMWRSSITSDTANINSKLDLSSSAHTVVVYSAVPFIIISFISFLAALAVEIRIWQSPAQKHNALLFREKRKEAREITNIQKGIDDEIKSTKSKMTNESGSTLHVQEYAFGNEQRLLTLADQVKSTYESANVEFRPGNDCPAFFGGSIAHEFKLYFNNIFNSIKS